MSGESVVFDRVSRVLKEVSGCRSLYGLEQNDMSFLHNLSARPPSRLSEKQERWLEDIESRVFVDQGDDDE